MPETFLHAGEHRRLVARLDVDHTIGGQTGLSEGRREKVRSGDAPKHLALGAGCYPGAEERGGRAVDGSVSPARDLMQGTTRKAFARESRVQLGDPERENRPRAPDAAFDLLDLSAQRLYGGLGPQMPS